MSGNLHCVVLWRWGARTGRVLGGLRFQPFVEDGDPHLATLGQRKGGRSERLHSRERAAEGAGFARSLLRGGGEGWTWLSGHTQPSCLGTLRSFRCSIPPGCLLSSEAPHCDMQPAAPALWPASTCSQTASHCAGIRPARGRPHLQQLWTQSTEAYTCVIGPLALTLETGPTVGIREQLFLPPR